MGQYYRIVFLDSDGAPQFYVCPYDMGDGIKLREHYDISSPTLNLVEALLSGPGHRLVWAGDYADPETNENLEAGEAAGQAANLYHIAESVAKYDPKLANAVQASYNPTLYLINHTKKEYVYIDKIMHETHSAHPLALLTVEGNGRGSGDHHEANEYIGYWARDHISVTADGLVDVNLDQYIELIVDF